MPDSSPIDDSRIGVQQGEPLRSCLSSTNLDDTIRTTLSLSLTVGDKKGSVSPELTCSTFSS